MRPRCVLAGIVLVHCGCAVVLAAAPSLATQAAERPAARFAQGPTVRQQQGRTVIEFAAAAPTDCAVVIRDAEGRLVRHLAAGMLGPNAPPPLERGTLVQRLVWDGNDEAGRPAGKGPFRVHVWLGLSPQLDGFIGFQPAALGSVRALAASAKGELFVFHCFGALHPNDNSLACSVYNRQGNYLRTILPYPAGLPEEKLPQLRQVRLADGRAVPFIYQAETRSFIPGAGDLPPQRAVATSDGRVAFVGIQERAGGALRYAQAGVAQVVVIGSDGSLPTSGALKTILANLSASGASLALSPDEKTVYAAGLREGDYEGKPIHAVLRFAWDDPQPQVFVGDKAVSGSDATHLNEPASVAVDGGGRVYVADKGNNRIAVFAADGSPLGSLAVEKPARVEVHPRTGAVYVLGGPQVNKLQKFAALDAPRAVAEITLPAFRHPRYTALMALDSSADPPVLWFGTPFSHYARFRLLRCEDLGAEFGKLVEVVPDFAPQDAFGDKALAGPVGAGPVTDVSIDPASGRLWTSSGSGEPGRFFHGPSGKPLPNPLPALAGSGNIAAMGRDGRLYVYHGYPSAMISRFTAAGQSLPFDGAEGKITGLGSPRVRGRGITADRHGNLYVLYQKSKEKLSPGDAEDANALAVYGPDGRLKHEKLIDAEIRSINSVRVDNVGNIYLAVGVRPADVHVPEDFAHIERGQPWKHGMNSTHIDWYPLLYGCIVQFGPQGGEIRSGSGGRDVIYGYDNKTQIKGARWMYFGVSPVPSWRTKGTPDVCLCESPRFDVDGFGRCFFPDVARCRIGVLDAAGNELCFFGAYGNQDSAGPGSAVPQPEIPLCWPQAVAVDEQFVYIGDRLNRRVVRVKLAYQAERSCEIR